MARRGEDGGSEGEGEDEGSDRDGEREPPRLVEAALDPHYGSSPPAINRPSSSTVADSASRSPATPPSYMTTMRSASARISSRSSLISSTPSPFAAASRRYACTVSIPATSSPRVGAAATRTAGRP